MAEHCNIINAVGLELVLIRTTSVAFSDSLVSPSPQVSGLVDLGWESEGFLVPGAVL